MTIGPPPCLHSRPSPPHPYPLINIRSYCSHPLMTLTLETDTATGGHRANYRWIYKRIRRNKSQSVIGRLWGKTHALIVFVISCCVNLIATVTCVVIILQYQQPSDYSLWLSVFFSVTSALRLRLDAPPPPRRLRHVSCLSRARTTAGSGFQLMFCIPWSQFVYILFLFCKYQYIKNVTGIFTYCMVHPAT